MDKLIVDFEDTVFELRGVAAKAMQALIDEVEDLRVENERLTLERDQVIKELSEENERLREALQQIANHLDNASRRDPASAPAMADIAKEALQRGKKWMTFGFSFGEP